MSDSNTADPATRGHWTYSMYPRRAENELPKHLKKRLEEERVRWAAEVEKNRKLASSSAINSTSS